MDHSLFHINSEIDLTRAAEVYRQKGRVHIPAFLSKKSATAMRHNLLEHTDWGYFLFAKDDVNRKHLWEVSAAARNQYTDKQTAELYGLAYTCVKEGYGFIYETCQLTEPDKEAGTRRVPHSGWMNSFSSFLNSRKFLKLSRQLTGISDIRRAEANPTSFGPGQFLAVHDDSAAATRRVAFVFNFSTSWKADFGGLLQFFSADGHIQEAFVPYFNSLNLFRVPQAHSVSCVSPFAPGRRLAVSGWLHA